MFKMKKRIWVVSLLVVVMIILLSLIWENLTGYAIFD